MGWLKRSIPKSNAPSARPHLLLSCSIGCFARKPRRDVNAVSLIALDQAHLPWRWTLDTFPFERRPGIDKAQIRSLADLDFLRRADNVLLIGKPGTGKTGIAIGLLREACLNGYSGRFYNAQTLFDEPYASLADRSTARLLKRLNRMQPLLIDEVGYLSLKPEQVNAFFRLMDERYSRVSTILTTNLDLPDWYEVFQRIAPAPSLAGLLRLTSYNLLDMTRGYSQYSNVRQPPLIDEGRLPMDQGTSVVSLNRQGDHRQWR
jgi:DNA replication protein DnaC